jgi:glycosyltransferase involved in cell wall biosynthesis
MSCLRQWTETPIVMQELPLVSIVTPCYNSGRFLEETIESVLSQDYPRIEYLIVDGGSSDNTHEIVQRYRERLQFYSEPDGGTADAINKGFHLSSGTIFAYLNADDIYLPGAVSTVVREFLEHEETAVIYGDGYWISDDGQRLGTYPTRAFDKALLSQECFICQPAAFMRRSAFEEAGAMNTQLNCAYDYDLWIRIARMYPMGRIDAFLASSRMHRGNKTIGRRKQVFQEQLTLLGRHYGYVPFGPIHAYSCYLLDGKDQFFEPSRPSIPKYVFSLFVGLQYNYRQPFRFVREWASVMSVGGLQRRWRDLWGG